MVNKEEIASLMLQGAEAAKAGHKEKAKHLMAQLINKIPANDMERDIAHIDVEKVAAALDTNHDNILSGTELVAFSRDPSRLDPALANTQLAGPAFKSAVEIALSQREKACGADPVAYEEKREFKQQLINAASSFFVPTFAVQNAIEGQLERSFPQKEVNPNGKENISALADISADLFKQFDKIELPTLNQVCTPTEILEAHAGDHKTPLPTQGTKVAAADTPAPRRK